MKKLLLILSVVCATVAVAAEASLDYFTAKSDGRSITVQWRSAVENNIRSYEVERSNDGKTFRYLKAINATGSNSEYRFSDE